MRRYVAFIFLTFSGCFVSPRNALASLFNDCIYTEEDVRIPQELADGALIVTKHVHQAIGVNPEYSCLPRLGKIDHELVGNEMETYDPSGWTKYFIAKGRIVEDISPGTTFRVRQVLRVIKHGWRTMDSGAVPIYYLILTDEKGILFQIATVLIGSDRKTEFLKFTSPSTSFMLEDNSFIPHYGAGAENTFKFERPLNSP